VSDPVALTLTVVTIVNEAVFTTVGVGEGVGVGDLVGVGVGVCVCVCVAEVELCEFVCEEVVFLAGVVCFD